MSWAYGLALLGLCAAYLQGGLDKLLDVPGAVAETRGLGLPFPTIATLATIATELLGSAMILSGRLRCLGALWLAGFTTIANLLANAFWTVPPGALRTGMANGFFEHLGLIGGFLMVAIHARPDAWREHPARASFS